MSEPRRFTIWGSLPCRDLVPHSRPDHLVHATAVKNYRDAWYLLAKEAGANEAMFGRWRSIIRLCPHTKGWRQTLGRALKPGELPYYPDDRGNVVCALKAAYDGLGDAQVFVSDDHEHEIALPDIYWLVVDPAHPAGFCEITIIEVLDGD